MPVEQWDVFEIELKGPSNGNPFVDVELSAQFECDGRTIDVPGFYDGDGVYRIRFMPDLASTWKYRTVSNAASLNNQTGALQCTPAIGRNRGPVSVAHRYHFAYADGTPYRQIGTTCYAMSHQPPEVEERTFKTLAACAFNKIRFCVFPKRYVYNETEPPRYPFQGKPPANWDFTRFNPEFFRHLEQVVSRLRDLTIEADVILFHPYDEGHWGFDRMDPPSDDRYLKYTMARLSAFRNVWWSLANEFDFMKEKKLADWQRYLQIIRENDPYEHLRSIHNGAEIFNHTDPAISHASIQNGSAVADFGRALLYRDVYRKPIIFDEVKYEGDIPQRWGDLSPEEMVHRFWQGTIAGAYVGHGETYLHSSNQLWWAHGGTLHGKSPPRLAFLRQILESAPPEGIDPIDKWQDDRTAGKAGEYYLVYLGRDRPTQWLFELPRAQLAEGMEFGVEILDTWNMTVTPVPGTFTIVADETYRYHAKGRKKVELPGQPFIALRIRRTANSITAVTPAARVYGEA